MFNEKLVLESNYDHNELVFKYTFKNHKLTKTSRLPSRVILLVQQKTKTLNYELCLDCEKCPIFKTKSVRLLLLPGMRFKVPWVSLKSVFNTFKTDII